jgi:hypothetical protein
MRPSNVALFADGRASVCGRGLPFASTSGTSSAVGAWPGAYTFSWSSEGGAGSGALELAAAGSAEVAGAALAGGATCAGSLEPGAGAADEALVPGLAEGALAGVSGAAPAGVLASSGCPAQPNATSKLPVTARARVFW